MVRTISVCVYWMEWSKWKAMQSAEGRDEHHVPPITQRNYMLNNSTLSFVPFASQHACNFIQPDIHTHSLTHRRVLTLMFLY